MSAPRHPPLVQPARAGGRGYIFPDTSRYLPIPPDPGLLPGPGEGGHTRRRHRQLSRLPCELRGDGREGGGRGAGPICCQRRAAERTAVRPRARRDVRRCRQGVPWRALPTSSGHHASPGPPAHPKPQPSNSSLTAPAPHPAHLPRAEGGARDVQPDRPATGAPLPLTLPLAVCCSDPFAGAAPCWPFGASAGAAPCCPLLAACCSGASAGAAPCCPRGRYRPCKRRLSGPKDVAGCCAAPVSAPACAVPRAPPAAMP